MEKIKILQIVPSLSLANGVAAYINNYYSHMNLSKFETTILVLNDDEKGRYEFFKEKGCKIVEFFKDCSWVKYISKVKDFFENNHFDIVHCHAANYGAFFMYYAKKKGVSVRILHSHANKSADTKLHEIRNNLLIPIAVRCSNFYIACSMDAGNFMFGRKGFLVLNNAINFNDYKFDKYIGNEYRKEFNLEGKFVVGSFGRLCPQKNQLFTLDIFNKILEKRNDAFLLLVGSGELKGAVLEKAKKLKIEDKILILDSRNDINKIYSCLDVFLLPSTYEGLGIVLIEAQANGLPCFTSNTRVPIEAKVCPLLNFIELNNNPCEWSDFILDSNYNQRVDFFDEICKSNFNIMSEASKLEECYLSFFEERKGK